VPNASVILAPTRSVIGSVNVGLRKISDGLGAI
jgi:hypothetical protein